MVWRIWWTSVDLWWTWRLFRFTKVNVWPLRLYIHLVDLVDLIHPNGNGARPLPNAAERTSPNPLRNRNQALEVHQVHQGAINFLPDKHFELVNLAVVQVHQGPPRSTSPHPA